jgi:hypothetical protein
MKAFLQIKNLNSDEAKRRVIRNLSRILDIKIIKVDIEEGTLFFLYACLPAFQKVKEELLRIGHPVQSCEFPISRSSQIGSSADYTPEL